MAISSNPTEGRAGEVATGEAAWHVAIPEEKLRRDGKAVVKIDGKQIALFATESGILACNNRCPHEGYPLREGTLDGCVLTCNWHNWKFDLTSGANLYGGDRLRIYPATLRDGAIWVDIADPPEAERQAEAMTNLRGAFDDHAYDRMARELARLAKAGGDPVAAVAAAIVWSHDRLEFGMTHAHAAAAGWLRLYDEATDAEHRLAALVEAVAYLSWDTLREPTHPYPTASLPWSRPDFLAAIEAQDETAAVARLRGALAEGLGYAELEAALTEAALAHYADFGHSLIYVVHTGALIARLGKPVEVPLLLALIRSLIYARREDLIPEFRSYAAHLRAWPAAPGRDAAWSGSVVGRSVEATLGAVVDAATSVAPVTLYEALLRDAAMNLLQYDTAWQDKTGSSIAQDIGWLDFTHGITFANAVRRQCAKFPALWPAGLLQMGCFVARNTGFTLAEPQLASWHVEDPVAFERAAIARIHDHGEDRYILAVHLLKTFLAAREEAAAATAPVTATLVRAATNRFLHAGLKRKHVLRTAHQALEFVALED